MNTSHFILRRETFIAQQIDRSKETGTRKKVLQIGPALGKRRLAGTYAMQAIRKDAFFPDRGFPVIAMLMGVGGIWRAEELFNRLDKTLEH
jgi:hypothetical protein